MLILGITINSFSQDSSTVAGQDAAINEKVTEVNGAGDVSFNTLGLGWLHYWGENVRFMFFYEINKNEETPNLAVYAADKKDNLFTARVQYKF